MQTAFIASLEDREAKGAPVKTSRRFNRCADSGHSTLAVGRRVRRKYRFPLAAWNYGTSAPLPGHIGYAVVPWKQGNGYAKRALKLLLPEAVAEGLPFVEITTDPENIASQRVILANGGILVEHFTTPPQFGSKPGLRYRIALP